MSHNPTTQPTPAQIRRWRQYVADEAAEGAIYRALAEKKTGQERQILLGLAEAEARHEEYWRAKLGEHDRPVRPSLSRSFLRLLAARFGSVFVLALAQRAEEILILPVVAEGHIDSGVLEVTLVEGHVVRRELHVGHVRQADRHLLLIGCLARAAGEANHSCCHSSENFFHH